MSYEITSGKISKAKKVVIYGPEGIGKSSFAAKFPNPLFIDTEGSTHNLSVRRLPPPTSWTMLGEELKFVIAEKPCKTLVIDTIDWAEMLCIEHVCAAANKAGIEDFGYGNGYVYEKEEFGKLLNRLTDVIDVGINVVLTAHAQLRKFSQPDEIGEYDRWELKLGKKTGSQISPLIKEWCDMLLFVNYKTYAVAVDKEGKKFKAQGNARTMYTEHHPCWDAKNRHGLPPEMPFNFEGIAHIFADEPKPESTTLNIDAQISQTPALKYWFDAKTNESYVAETPPTPDCIKCSEEDYKLAKETKAILEAEKKETVSQNTTKDSVSRSSLPKALVDLMTANNVNEAEIMHVVGLKGYYTQDTPIENYDSGFISGVLIGAWDKVFAMIKQQRELNNIPF